jgi:hypothetical protein
MKNWRQLLGNERGTALALALIILVVMTALAAGLLAMGGVESRISASQSAGSRARLLAESGIEYALLILADKNFSTTLAAGFTLIPDTCLPVPVMPCDLALGKFNVTIRNDITAGDALLTGVAEDNTTIPAGTATLDRNGVLILTSTGIADGATRVIVAAVQRGVLNLNAAVTLPGVQADTTTDSRCPNPNCPNPHPFRNYSIDGRDWTRADTITPTGVTAAKLGIATAIGTESITEAGFDDANGAQRGWKQDILQGKNESAAGLAIGNNTINGDNTLTPAILAKFMANLAANPATQIITSNSACQFGAAGGDHNKPEGIHMASTATPGVVTVKNTCSGAAKIDKTINLGSPTSPQMIYFKGEFDPSSNFVGVGVDGTQDIRGYGLLVVEDADLNFFQTGNFRWDGIVLVTGRNVAVAFKGDSSTEIRGALIGSETNPLEPGGYFEYYNRTTDTMLIRASQQNVDMALNALYNMRVTSYREVCNTPPCS